MFIVEMWTFTVWLDHKFKATQCAIERATLWDSLRNNIRKKGDLTKNQGHCQPTELAS